MQIKRCIVISFLLVCFHICIVAQDIKHDDIKKLERAIEYFQGRKYHEALLLLQDLNKKYALNPRFKAYLGVCYYYDWDYKNACKFLEEIINDLNILAPHEQAVYYYCLAESYFIQNKYNEAVPFYEKTINICYDNEKADILYKLAMCYMNKNCMDIAYDYFQSSLAYYKHFGIPNDKIQRIIQINNMIQEYKERH